MPGRDLFANDPPKKKGRDLFAIPAASQRQGTPDFQNGGMDLVSDGGAQTLGQMKIPGLQDYLVEQANEDPELNNGSIRSGADALLFSLANAALSGQLREAGNKAYEGTSQEGYGDKAMLTSEINYPMASITGRAIGFGYGATAPSMGVAHLTENFATRAGLKFAGKGGTNAARAARYGVRLPAISTMGAAEVAAFDAISEAPTQAFLEGNKPIELRGNVPLIGETGVSIPKFRDSPAAAAHSMQRPVNWLVGPGASVIGRAGRTVAKGSPTPAGVQESVFRAGGPVPVEGNLARNSDLILNVEAAALLDPKATQLTERILRNSGLAPEDIVSLNERARQVIEAAPDGVSPRLTIGQIYSDILYQMDKPQAAENIIKVLRERRNVTKPNDRSPAIVGSTVNELRGSQVPFLDDSLQRNLGSGRSLDTVKQVDEWQDVLGAQYEALFAPGASAPKSGSLEKLDEAVTFWQNEPKLLEKVKMIAKQWARQNGVPYDDSLAAYKQQDPRRFAHWMKSAAGDIARQEAKQPAPDGFTINFWESAENELAKILDEAAPGYKDVRTSFAQSEGVRRATDFGDRFLTMAASGKKTDRFIDEFNNLSPTEQEYALESIREALQVPLRGGGEDMPARLARLNNIGTLDLLEQLGPKGKAVADDIRAIGEESRFLNLVDSGNPARQSATFSNADAASSGPDLYSGRAANALGGNIPGAVGMDMGISALSGTPVPWFTMRSGLQSRLRPRTASREAMTEFLMMRPHAGARPAPPSGAPPAPQGPGLPPRGVSPGFQRGVNAFANNESGFMRPDAAGTMMTAGGAGVGAMNPIDFDGDGKTSAKERAMTAALYGGGAYAANRGVHGLDRLGRAPKGAATEFRVRPGESGSSKIQFRAGGERWADIPTGFGSEAEATAQMQRLQAGKPLQADVLYGPPKDEFEAMFRSWFEQTQGRTAPRFAEAIQNNNGLVGKALWEMDPSGETFARYLQKYDPEEWAQYMGPGGGADGKSFDAALGRVIDNLGNEVDSMTRPSGSNAGRDFNLETWNPNKPKSSGPAMFRHDLANAAVGGTVGGMGGSFSGEFTDYNGDGVIDETDKQIGFMIGTGLGAFGAPIGTRFGTPGNKFTRGAGPKTVKQAMRAELPGSPEYERAVAKGLDMSPQARMQRARDMGFDTDTVLYHGTATPFSEGKGIIWGSTKPDLANDYAAMRGHMNDRDRAAGKSVAENQGLVKALVARREKTFDADLMPKTVTAPEFLTTVLEQSGKNFSEAETARLRGLFDTVRKARLREESGPHYGRHDFWYEPETLFGKDGAKAITEIFDMAGFDSIKMIEDGQVTYGIRNPANIRSVNAAFDPDMAASPMLTAGPSGKLPKLMKDVPKGTRRPGERPNLSGTIQRGQEQTSGVPIAKAIGGEGLAYRTAKREAEDMMARNVDLEEIQRRTGLVPISYRGQMVWRGVDGEVTAYEANELFYEALKLPPAERPEWVKQVLDEIGPKVETLNLGGKDAPLRLGGPNTPMRNSTAPNNVPRNALLGGLGAVGVGTAYYMSRDPKR